MNLEIVSQLQLSLFYSLLIMEIPVSSLWLLRQDVCQDDARLTSSDGLFCCVNGNHCYCYDGYCFKFTAAADGACILPAVAALSVIGFRSAYTEFTDWNIRLHQVAVSAPQRQLGRPQT